MKFTETTNGFYTTYKNLFKFTISTSNKMFYVVVSHTEKDIRFNTLWSNIEFTDFESAQFFCENFNPINYRCIGLDTKNPE